MGTKRILVSEKAAKVIRRLKEDYGDLIFHQSGGCCEGSYPHCFQANEFRIGDSDICLGEIEGCKFYMAKDQFTYWKHTQLTLDVLEGRGASFSLESVLDMGFIIRSRIFTEAELEELGPII
ncbi:DUF779 domain-containing protein [Olivibacter sp. SDN3]|uniref:DUF779 domain-containing protein n=1 Tax=Olivibacter sp. SDN3 TaxID=2764720 RepID=UPI00165182A2|nr:DUF779 domain-containing protein [Olivibacter sp. SDN3]QNL47822.1 DUF779 domain-containing protein [Olivibacter sp. SDN3]